MQYIHAIKNLNKKYYLTPFLLIIYVYIIIQLWDGVGRFIKYSDKEGADFVIFIVSFFKVYTLMMIRIIFYPHATFFIQTTWLYRKIFGSMMGSVKSGFSTYMNIGKNIPDDYRIRSTRGNVYTVSSGFKTKFERIREMRGVYLYLYLMKFILIDLALRGFIHLGIYAVSPIIFLIAIPLLKKRGLLEGIEK